MESRCVWRASLVLAAMVLAGCAANQEPPPEPPPPPAPPLPPPAPPRPSGQYWPGAAQHAAWPAPPDFNTEEYGVIHETGFVGVTSSPLSTFSIDVDTASYANVRRFLRDGMLPPPDAVRIEELIQLLRLRLSGPG